MGSLLKSKWGVASIFGGLAILICTGVVDHADTKVQLAADIAAGVVGGGLGVAAKKVGEWVLSKLNGSETTPPKA